MERPALEVADLVRAAGERFVETSRGWLNGQHLKVLSAIQRCRCAADSLLASSRLARSCLATTNPLAAAGIARVAAVACGSSNASAPLSCAFARRPHSPPPDATTFSSSIHPVASARTALVRLVEVLRRVPLAPIAEPTGNSLAPPCDHASKRARPAALAPSNRCRSPLRAFCPPDSKRIDSQIPRTASFKSLYRKRLTLSPDEIPPAGSPAIQH